MSLRLLAGLLVGAAILLTPSFGLLLLRLFPPPEPLLFTTRLCAPDEKPTSEDPCVNAVDPGGAGVRVRTLAIGPGISGQVPSLHIGPQSATGDGEELETGPLPALPGPRMAVLSRPGAGLFGLRAERPLVGPLFDPAMREHFDAMRRHFMWINLASLLLVVGCAVWLASLTLRRPLRALLAAIGDIERGAAPPVWAFSGPSELKSIGRSLHHLGRQLRSNLQERELMLAGLSHDLRSPLARIQAAVELRGGDRGGWGDTLRDIREIDHIVGQCIDYARDGQDEPLHDASLDSIVRALLGSGDGGVQLALDAPQALPLRVAALRRALRNLVDNARLHGAPPVVVRTRIDGSEAVLSMTDGGAGIDPADWQRLRQPFARGSQARSPGGCGLGLAIVQRVADLHGGRLLLRARGGNGPFGIELRLPLGTTGQELAYKPIQTDSD